MITRLAKTGIVEGPVHKSHAKVSYVGLHTYTFNLLVSPLYVTHDQATLEPRKISSRDSIDLWYRILTLTFSARWIYGLRFEKTFVLQIIEGNDGTVHTPRFLHIATRDLTEDTHYIDSRYVLSSAVRRRDALQAMRNSPLQFEKSFSLPNFFFAYT